MKSLRPLLPGQTARLVRVGGEGSFRRRLLELGFLPGTLIRLVRRVDIGDLVEFEVRGAHITLRCADADQLLFDPER